MRTTLTLALLFTLAACGVSGFNKRRWNTTDKYGYPVHRLAMWDEVDNHLRTGMTLGEVTKRLGEGDPPASPELERQYTPGSRFYELGEGFLLVVQFSEDKTVIQIGMTR